ncbi:sentrin-specific protease 1-like isoform X2 [Physella acuta]|uniref:sentrin-specific protease 1-like isoform X2 n=1 Tax=Physella acuta TaxID=109671 RepID=UPI0027DBA8C7|nr:sentrin-specific protease 1-like isoform X2 [Physella acuta]
MFKSLTEALRTLFNYSSNDHTEPQFGYKRKRKFEENDAADGQVRSVEKKRRIDLESSSNSLFNLSTVKKSASRMANFLESNPSFSKLFNVKAIDESDRWGKGKSNGSTSSQINGDDRLKANERLVSRYNLHQQTGPSNNGELKQTGYQPKPMMQRTINSSIFKNNKESEACKCIRLKEKEEYQKLLQLHCQPNWPVKTLFSTKTIPQEANSSHISTSTPRQETKLQDNQSLSRSSLSALIALQRKNAGFSTLQRSGLRDVSGVQNKPKESHTSSSTTDDCIIIEETPAVEIKQDPDLIKQTADSSRRSFLQSKFFNDKEIEERIKSRKEEQERRKRLIEEEECKAKAYAEKRRAQEMGLEKRLKYQMRIFDEEPSISEEIFKEDEEEEEALPEFTNEMQNVVTSAFRGNPNEVLAKGFGLQITRRDILTLKDINWLNDEVINFYMNMLMKRGEETNIKAYAFNTFFYPKIMSGGHQAVKRWTKKVDIFDMKHIIIPVHLGMHWCLCMVNIKEKSITYYDSMGGKNNSCLKAVFNYLKDERIAKNQTPLVEKEWKAQHAENNPHQMNGGDCGMFMCKYAEYITRDKPITFTQEDMPYFRKRMVYEILTQKLLQ